MKYALFLLLLASACATVPTPAEKFGCCVTDCWTAPRKSAWDPVPRIDECVERCRAHLPPRHPSTKPRDI